MKWSYGITTIPSRLDDGVFERTLDSLKKSGFDKPRLFIDGCDYKTQAKYLDLGLDITAHSPNLRTFGNWITALWEIYLREPHADRYALFQDDFITGLNLREYLEKIPYPKSGYQNLLTFPTNQELCPDNGKYVGWYKSNQRGLGAVAIVFNRDCVLKILSSYDNIVNRPMTTGKRAWKAIDGGIVDCLKKKKIFEFVHNPSLVFHTGEKTTIRNAKFPDTPSFQGEDFDFLSLIVEPEPELEEPKKDNPDERVVKMVKRTKRIGLVGFNVASGLGEKNRQTSTHLEIDVWMVKPHRSFKTLSSSEFCDTIHCPTGRKIPIFLKNIDTVLFDETPYYSSLPADAKRAGKRVVCIPAMEWTPPPKRGPWLKHVDLFICPTRQAYRVLKADGLPCTYFPWPTDTERFKFKQQTKCTSFLFLNGRGGWKTRKGSDVMKKAYELWPEMPLLIRDQTGQKWPDGVVQLPKTQSNADLYSQGCVLINPCKVDGTGLQPREAMSCGMPVISTDGDPWNELPSIGKIESKVERVQIKRMVDWYNPSPESLVEVCKSILGTDISQASKDGREWAESNSFSNKSTELTELVRNGVHD